MAQGSAEKLMALRTKLRSGLWESKVVPLVRKEYNQRHMVEGNVRQQLGGHIAESVKKLKKILGKR